MTLVLQLQVDSKVIVFLKFQESTYICAGKLFSPRFAVVWSVGPHRYELWPDVLLFWLQADCEACSVISDILCYSGKLTRKSCFVSICFLPFVAPCCGCRLTREPCFGMVVQDWRFGCKLTSRVGVARSVISIPLGGLGFFLCVLCSIETPLWN